MSKKVLLFVCSIITFVLAQVVVVFADTVPEGYYRIKNVKSGLYMDYSATENFSNIYQKQYTNPGEAKKFLILDSMTKGYSHIRAYDALDMLVDVNGASAENYTNIQLYKYNRSDAQKWSFILNDNGSYRIMAKCASDLKGMTVINASMDSGANIFQHTYAGSGNDQWYLEPVIEDGEYYIRNKQNNLYFTLNGYYIQQKEYTGDDYQKFKITSSIDGYYYITPITKLKYDVQVAGWDSGSTFEGAKINIHYGQSDEAQRWKFMLNSNGSFRIVSELGDDTKAITSIDDDTSQLYWYTYTDDMNSDWELVNQTEGKYVSVILGDKKSCLQDTNISAENFNQWISNLDACYEKYAELVDKKPVDGKKMIYIASGNSTSMETYPGDRIVAWNKTLIAGDLQKVNKGDWLFAALHEMGHAFDVDSRWVFDDEFFANFKMAYVLKQLDGQFKFNVDDPITYVDSYEDIKHLYKSVSDMCYDDYLGGQTDGVIRYEHEKKSGEKVAAVDSLIYIFLDCIDREPVANYDRWNCFKNAFRWMVNPNEDVEFTDTASGRWDYLVYALNEVAPSGIKPFSLRLSDEYCDQIDFVYKYYENSDNSR